MHARILGFAFATFVCQLAIGQSIHEKRLKNRLKLLEDAQLPFDNKSSLSFYQSKTKNERTERWLALFESINNEEFHRSSSGIPLLDSQLQDVEFEPQINWKHREKVKQFLDKHHDSLREFRALCSYREAVQFPFEFEGFYTVTSWTAATLTLAKMNYLAGLIAIIDEDWKEVEACVWSLIGAAEVSSEEPFFVCRAHCYYIHSLAIQLTQVAMPCDGLERDFLIDLRNELLIQPSNTDWRASMERCRGVHLQSFFDQFVYLPDLTKLRHPPNMNRSVDCLFFIETMERAAEIESTNLNSLLHSAQRLDLELDYLFLTSNKGEAYGVLLSPILIPSNSICAHQYLNHAIEKRIAAIAISIELYRQEHGKLPESLAVLPLGVRKLRPVGNQPFGYVTSDRTATLWGFELPESSSTPPLPPTGQSPWVWRWGSEMNEAPRKSD